MEAVGGTPSAGAPVGGAPSVRRSGAMRRIDPTFRQLPRMSMRYAGLRFGEAPFVSGCALFCRDPESTIAIFSSARVVVKQNMNKIT